VTAVDDVEPVTIAGTTVASVILAVATGPGGRGRYVAVATPRGGRWDPDTWREAPGPDDPDAPPAVYAAPHLSPAEARTLADHVTGLLGLAESGIRPAPPGTSRYVRTVRRLRHLLAIGAVDGATPVHVAGDDDPLPLIVADLLDLLPPEAGPATLRYVRTAAIDAAGGDTGGVWVDITGDGHLTVNATETDEHADDNPDNTARLTPAAGRELATTLRRLARTADRNDDRD
jgi:hypothetical protein